MITGISTCRVNPGKFFFSTTVLSASVVLFAASQAVAQTGSSQLTVENLIGQAVSLSNQDYPEVEKAIQRFRNRDYEGAHEFLKSAKDKHPNLPPTFVTLAKMYMLEQNMQAAHGLLERTVIDNPEDPEAYLLLADQAFAGNRTTESDALFHMADPVIEQFEGNAKRKRNFEIRLLAGKAAIAERRQQWDRAHDLLTQWVEMDPDNGLGHARLGVALFMREKTKEAFDSFTKARDLNPDMPHPYVSLGKLFSQSADMETDDAKRTEKRNRARQAFERAYNEDKTNVNTTREFAEWLIQRGELDQAAELAASLREMSPDSAAAVLLDGVVALMQDRKDHAEQAFTRALTLDPGNARATDLLALLLIESDSTSDRERALRYAQINAQQFANNPQVNITMGYVLYRMGRTNEANEALQAGARGQLQADSAFLIAVIMAEQGQKEQAREALQQVINQKAGLFIFRKRAEDLLRDLTQEAG